MAVSRASIVDANLRAQVGLLTAGTRRADLDSPIVPGAQLTCRRAIQIFEAQVTSRTLDLVARELKAQGHGFYTIGGSGHEGNAAVAMALSPSDPAFLHYRSGGFFIGRSRQVAGPAGEFDVLLGMVGSRDEPIAGGRHKVFGSIPLAIPPQTSTIASHLPKALGAAIAMDRRARWEGRRESRIAVCTFGDASSNHASATTAFNAAGWTKHQNVPAPILFVCEDNGLGISVRTPSGWIEKNLSSRHGIEYFAADGLDLVDAYEQARAAADWVRRTRSPAVLHLRTVRLLGHAGSDVEQLYRTTEEIERTEAADPLLRSARCLVEQGCLTPEQITSLYDDTRKRLDRLAEEVVRRSHLRDREDVMRPLFFHSDDVIRDQVPVAPTEARSELFRTLPEGSSRQRHMAFQLNRALKDVLLAVPEAIVFGEDVARKGGVYHVTAGLTDAFGVGRVFNTLLDETSILGLAMGAAHEGLLPIPEVQYLAYLMNAIDQLRGEASSLQFFSQGQYANPMVVRIAGLAYQKGFGGHFHNDNGIAALREIPGILIGCPARGDDAARMLRSMVTAARELGRVCVLLEPIALYMTKDLHETGDGLWLTDYPEPSETLPVGSVRIYGEEGDADLCIATYANGLWMSLRVAKRLEHEGHRVRLVDVRWLHPLPYEAVAQQAADCGRLLIVDECRRHSGIASDLSAEVGERTRGQVRIARVVAPDSFIPLGGAANDVLVTETDIERAARALLEAE